MIRTILTSLALSSFCFSNFATALIATQSVEREVTITHADGSKTTKLEMADLVMPGDKIVYSLAYHNEANLDVENIVLVMPVPTEVKYLEGSADSTNAQTRYSTDNGMSYANRTQLIVKLDDGASRAANAEDITHIRWALSRSVSAGSSGILSFRGQLK